MGPVYYVLRFLETLFNGEMLHSAMLNFPVQTIAVVYRRSYLMLKVFLCFGWVSALVTMIPFSKASEFGWLFRGAFLPIMGLYYILLRDLNEFIIPGTPYNIVTISFTQNTFYTTLLVALVFGAVVILLDPAIKFTATEQAELKRRATEYKNLMSLNVRMCSECENFIMLRSVHSSLESRIVVYQDKCIAKYEYQSWVLNKVIGARNLLPMFMFNACILIYHYSILEICFSQIESQGLTKMSTFAIFRLYLTAILGFIFALKETIIVLASLLTGTTAFERGKDLQVPYFKTRNNTTLPFDKGPLVHLQEAFYAMIGYNPASKASEESNTVFEGDEESEIMARVDLKLSSLLNLHATRYPGNWQKIYLMTLLEIEGEVSEFMGKALRQALFMKMKGKVDEENSGSEDEIEEAAREIYLQQKQASYRRPEPVKAKCCDHDHKSGDHSASKHGNHGTGHSSKTETALKSGPENSNSTDLDQSTSNLDQSYEI